MADLQERLLDLIPDDMTIWEDDDELKHFADRGLRTAATPGTLTASPATYGGATPAACSGGS